MLNDGQGERPCAWNFLDLPQPKQFGTKSSVALHERAPAGETVLLLNLPALVACRDAA